MSGYCWRIRSSFWSRIFAADSMPRSGAARREFFRLYRHAGRAERSCNSRARRNPRTAREGGARNFFKGNAMQEEQPRPRRFVGIGRKVSLFFLTAVFGVIGVILLVSYKQGAFVRHTAIYFYAADAFGISKGMAVGVFRLAVGHGGGPARSPPRGNTPPPPTPPSHPPLSSR